MEKYRKFGDASTGINPFIAKGGVGSGSGVVAAATGGIGSFSSASAIPPMFVTVLAAVVFPIRLLVLLVVAAVLGVFDMLSRMMYTFGVGFAADLLLYPFIGILTRLWLLVAAGVVVRQRIYPIRGSTNVTVENGAKALDDTIGAPKAGDVVIANLVSPLDFLAITSCGSILPPFLSGAKPSVSSSSPSFWRMPSCLCVFIAHREPTVISFGPNPWQRWQVFRHVMHSTTSQYLKGESRGLQTNEVIDLTLIQRRAKRMGIPVLLFPEGTPSNGQGMLQCPRFLVENASSAGVAYKEVIGGKGAGSSGTRTHIVSVSYASTVPCRIIESDVKAMKGAAPFVGAGPSGHLQYLFNLSRRGSGIAATGSTKSPAAIADAILSGVLSVIPIIPVASGFVNTCRVTIVRASQIPTMPMTISAEHLQSNSAMAAGVVGAWVDECRGKVCASVSFNNPNVVCRPVAVGVREKIAYMEYVENEIVQEHEEEMERLRQEARGTSGPVRPRPAVRMVGQTAVRSKK